MTPDMKRLCDLAAAEIPCPYDEEGRPLVDVQDRVDAAEAIVRAVLIELMRGGESAFDATAPKTPQVIDYKPRLRFVEVINHILAEPAKA